MENPKIFYSIHKIELFAGLFGIILAGVLWIAPLPASIKISSETALFLSILSSSLALASAFIRNHISNEIYTLRLALEKNNQINSILAQISGSRFKFANKELTFFLERLNRIKSGTIPLNETDYYRLITEKMDISNKKTEIKAVSSFDERRWSSDHFQKRYIEANDMAKSNGASISRIFIISKRNIKKPDYAKGIEEIKRQLLDQETNVSIVWQESLTETNNEQLMQDWVMFTEKSNKEIYKATPVSDNPSRVLMAELILNVDEEAESTISDFEENYKNLALHTVDEKDFLTETEYLENPVRK